jgi:phage gp36-like protein
MALTLNLTNFSQNNILEFAKVATDTVAGGAVLPFDNAQNFAGQDFILVGKQGGGVSRVYQITSLAGNNVTLSENLVFPVERGTQITKLFGNKLKVYSAPYMQGSIPADGDYTLVTGGTINIDPDQLITQFTDQNGSDQFWYKYTFYNSITQGETQLRSSSAVRDTSATDYATIGDVRQEAGFNGNYNVTDELIYRKLQAAQAKINGMLSGRYVLPIGQPVSPIIADLTVRLAAGYVMIAEYGTFDGQDKSKGEKLRDDAISELKDYQTGSQVITDLQAVNTEIIDAGGFDSGFTEDNPLGFSRNDIVGYNERVY